MNKISSLFFFIGIIFSFPAETHAEEASNLKKPMFFTQTGNGGSCSVCKWTTAVGIIDETTPDVFNKYLETYSSPGQIQLQSPGGNLLAGMELGRIFRKHGLTVYADGICASACAYAFLGGASRDTDENSKLGFHQFYKDPLIEPSVKLGKYSISEDQIISGFIASYLVEMGIDARVLTLASLAGKGELITPNERTLKELKIVNSSTDFSDWKIELHNEGIRAQATKDDPTELERVVSTYCLASGMQRMYEIETEKTSDFEGARGAKSLKDAIENINLYLNEDTNKREKPIEIPVSQIETRINKDSYSIILKLSEAAVDGILSSSNYEILIESPYGLFGNRQVNIIFSPSREDKMMMKYSWSNCEKN